MNENDIAHNRHDRYSSVARFAYCSYSHSVHFSNFTMSRNEIWRTKHYRFRGTEKSVAKLLSIVFDTGPIYGSRSVQGHP